MIELAVNQFLEYIHNQYSRTGLVMLPVDYDPYPAHDTNAALYHMSADIEQGFLRVWTGASDTCLWTPQDNWLNRFVHDMGHVQHRLGFTVPDELVLADRLEAQAPNRLIKAVIESEVRAQIEYYAQFGDFPRDQKAFQVERLERTLNA